MAHYDYRCRECGFTYELNVPIADRDKPIEAGCPNAECPATFAFDGDGKAIVERLIAAPGVSYVYGDSVRKHTPESFKDVLRNIKSKHLHSTIDV